MAKFMPLAARLRPVSLDHFFGQTHLLAPNKPLRRAIEQGQLHSMILWGPPGTGKTTLALLMAQKTHAHFVRLSAVLDGVKEIRKAADIAQKLQQEKQQATLLFIDEVHRFNKAQQDALLPFIEDGTLSFIGATTENPSFALNNALLSRARVYVLKSLNTEELLAVINRALLEPDENLQQLAKYFPQSLRQKLAFAADGDARRALNLLEILQDLDIGEALTENALQKILDENLTARRFDKQGDIFYDQISALHKSVRGSSPDAALYWLSRMLDGGCDPLYLARRIARMASEDIGNADPRALTLALNAWEIQERMGSPEGELALAQTVVYLACAAKSNAVYTAFGAAMNDAKNSGSLDVPLHLRNAPTGLMKNLNYGKDYRYAHDEQNAYVAGENYFPEELSDRQYYYPVTRGLEIQIGEKLKTYRDLDQKARMNKPMQRRKQYE